MDKKFIDLLKIRLGKAVGYGIWVLILLLSLSVARNMAKISGMKRDVQKELARMAKMQKENADLEAQIVAMQGPDFVEQQIRNKLGLVKEGEAVVILPDEETVKKLAPTINKEEETLPDANWQKWLALF